MPSRIFITVAEVSGDKHAAQLIRSLKQLDPDAIIEGLGGPEMSAAGATIHRDTVTHAAMGWRGALRAVEIHGVLRWTRRHFQQNRPALWIGVDSPSMNFHFARSAKEMGVPTLQYVAPQLWAWAPRRMKKLRKWVDHVACILPFEEDYFRGHGVKATFVGHPLFDELPADRYRPAGEKFPNRPPVIGLLPGSRRSEAETNFPGLLAAAATIRKAFPDATFLVPTTHATHPIVERLVTGSQWNGQVDRTTEQKEPTSAESALGAQPMEPTAQPGEVLVNALPALVFGKERFDEMVPRCDLCLTVSGTATLHVAAFGVPMIVVYRANRAVWELAGRWLVPTRTFALVNVLATRRKEPLGATLPSGHIVREFVPWFGDSDLIAKEAIDYLRHPEELAAQALQLRRLVADLDRSGASISVARLAIDMIDSANNGILGVSSIAR
jgi:lipid-A-disaccharide synthase